MSRVQTDEALRDSYIGRVNAVLEQGREDLAAELATAYEIDRLLLAGRSERGQHSRAELARRVRAEGRRR